MEKYKKHMPTTGLVLRQYAADASTAGGLTVRICMPQITNKYRSESILKKMLIYKII